jgi:L-lactate dehydrogenase
VITAGAKQNPGQTRIELAGVNAGIMKKMMPQLLEAAPNAIYVIVTNPCDVLTVLAQEDTGLPPERLFASGTVLDTSRLRWNLAARAGVSTSSVHAYIVGEHGDTEFPLWSAATIGTVPILDWVTPRGDKMTVDELDQIAIDVRDAAYKVIQGKGATNYAIGLSSARIIEAILGDEHAVMPVSPVLHDFHGVDGVALSVPSIVSAKGAVPIRETAFAPNELELFHRSADALREVAQSLRG